MSLKAVIFDLDGTLVQTEKIKAYSYAKALQELSDKPIKKELVFEAFKSLVGLSRSEVAKGLLEKFSLEETARERMTEFGVTTPWQAFVQIRLKYYNQLIFNPDTIRSSTWPHAISLLLRVRQSGYKVGLATMSYCPQVNYILDTLNIRDSFDFVASRDDVEHGKPDPEIYNLVARVLGIPSEESLVIEDSPSGVKAALSAGMRVIAVTTQFTHSYFRENSILDAQWVVHDPQMLPIVFRKMADGS